VGAWRGRLVGVLPIGLLAVCLIGCSQGVREYAQYTEAFNLQYQQGDELLNTIAKAERTLFKRRAARSGTIQRFDPNQAAYYVDTVDPPVTGSIRGSIKSLKLYNDALGALASGEAAEALTGRVGTLVSSVVGTIAATQIAAGGAAKALQADKLIAGATKYLTDASPILKQLMTWVSREAFREQLIAAYPTMKGLLLELRNGTPAMYFVLERYRSDRADTATGLSQAATEALNKDREQLAGWVLLMDKTLSTMDAAVIAAMNNAPDTMLASLSETSIELKVLAEKVKSLRAK